MGKQVQQAEEPLQQPKQLPSAPVEHGLLAMFFDEPKQIPTVGFIEKPETIFRHRDSIAISNIHTAEFPIANTCALQL